MWIRKLFERDAIDELSRLYKHVRRLMDLWDDHDAPPRLNAQIAAQTEKVQHAQEEWEAAEGKAAKKLKKAHVAAENQLKSLQAKLNSCEQRWDEAQRDRTLATELEQHADIRSAVLVETAKLHEGDSENRALWNEFLPQCKLSMQEIYDRLGVTFDHELGESFYHDSTGGCRGISGSGRLGNGERRRNVRVFGRF